MDDSLYFSGSSNFRYNLSSNSMGDSDNSSEFSGILDIYVHHARNIHNICIYENQDVYVKFSLTYDPDETISTQISNRGGKNPDFNETVTMKVNQPDAVLKCEIWMLSRVRNYLEDQLLGFALIPISEITGKGKVSRDYCLSSTDLFHSPAGILKLTLCINTSLPPPEKTGSNSSISSEITLLDRGKSENFLDPVDFSRIEFPNIEIVRENQKMALEYFAGINSTGVASFLHLGNNYEMTSNSSDQEHNAASISPNSVFLSSTTTNLSDDRSSAVSGEKKTRLGGESDHNTGGSPDTPTSKKESENSKDDESSDEGNMESAKFGQVFSAPNLESGQSAMQQQIVDMYMRSMQQFTESLAKMKLPMDLGKQQEHGIESVQSHSTGNVDQEKKKDGSRVFYGSRAFF